MRNVIWILFLLVMYGCSEESVKDNSDEHTEGNKNHSGKEVSSIELKELIPSDSYDVTSTRTFKFGDDGISYFVAAQEIENGKLFSSSDTTFVSYTDGGMVVTDRNGNVRTYMMNDLGCAVSCCLQEGGGTERNYYFSYTADEAGFQYLSGITEKLDGGEVYSQLTLDYSEDGMIKIGQTVDGMSETYIVEFDKSASVENVCELPDIFLSELYPMSMHLVALYGGVLGNAFKYLCTDMYPENSPDLNEHTTYEYSVYGKGIPYYCKIITVSGGEEYVRNISVKITI